MSDDTNNREDIDYKFEIFYAELERLEEKMYEEEDPEEYVYFKNKQAKVREFMRDLRNEGKLEYDISCVKTTHHDPDNNALAIDVYFGEEEDEGLHVADFDLDTGKIFWLKNGYRSSPKVLNLIGNLYEKVNFKVGDLVRTWSQSNEGLPRATAGEIVSRDHPKGTPVSDYATVAFKDQDQLYRAELSDIIKTSAYQLPFLQKKRS